MTSATPDPLAAELAAIRERAAIDNGIAWKQGRLSAEVLPRLVAAVERLLKPHQPGRIAILGGLCKRHEAHRYFSITSTEAASVTECPDCTAAAYVSCAGCDDGRGAGVALDLCPVRSAISAELLGQDAGKDGTDATST